MRGTIWPNMYEWFAPCLFFVYIEYYLVKGLISKKKNKKTEIFTFILTIFVSQIYKLFFLYYIWIVVSIYLVGTLIDRVRRKYIEPIWCRSRLFNKVCTFINEKMSC